MGIFFHIFHYLFHGSNAKGERIWSHDREIFFKGKRFFKIDYQSLNNPLTLSPYSNEGIVL